jgi:hypothetical protein
MPAEANSIPMQLIRLGAALGPGAVGLLVNVLLSTLLPGAKGNLRAERQHFYEGHQPDQVRSHLEKRLLADNFKLVKTGDPLHVRAERLGKRPKESVMGYYPFERLKLHVDVHFQPHPQGSTALLKARTSDFILLDTGETYYLQAVLDFLSLKPTIRPVKPSLNGKAFMSMLNAIVGAFVPLFFLMKPTGAALDALFSGIVLGCVAQVILAGLGIGEILVGGKKYRGIAYALVTVLLSVATIAGAVFLRYFH